LLRHPLLVSENFNKKHLLQVLMPLRYSALEPVFDALAIALGRKNHLFSGSIEGAGRVAAFYSLIETAKLHKVEPWEYISYLFQNLDDNGKCKAIMPSEFEKIVNEINS
jgi:hypothetical protein